MHPSCWLLSTALVLSAGVVAQDDDYVAIDYAKIDRRIAKLPAMVAEPLHALFVFGPKGDTRMWAVLDKSKPELPYYDVLYFDKNANGDLSEAGERITTRVDPRRAAAGTSVSLRIDKLPIPGTELVHTKLLISTVRKAGRTGIWFRMRWDGEITLSGGYGPAGMNVTAWSKSPATAPVLRPTPLAPLAFATWGSSTVALKIGGSTHVNVIAGSPGSGPDTLAVVDEHFLDLTVEELWVSVIGKDSDGKRIVTRSRIQAHC